VIMDRDERAWREVEKQSWREALEEFKKIMAESGGDVRVAFEYHEHEPFVRLIIELPGDVSFACPVGAPELRKQAQRFMEAADHIERLFGPDLDFGTQSWHEGHHDHG